MIRLKIFTIEFQKSFTTDDGNIPHADQSNFIKLILYSQISLQQMLLNTLKR